MTEQTTTTTIVETTARNLRALLAAERWSGRRAALAMGLSPMYVGRRLKGEAELSVSDIDSFARLLKMDPSALHAYLVRTNHEPTVPAV